MADRGYGVKGKFAAAAFLQGASLNQIAFTMETTSSTVSNHIAVVLGYKASNRPARMRQPGVIQLTHVLHWWRYYEISPIRHLPLAAIVDWMTSKMISMELPDDSGTSRLFIKGEEKNESNQD